MAANLNGFFGSNRVCYSTYKQTRMIQKYAEFYSARNSIKTTS